MNTLTAEKARELRDAITKNAAVIEPTIRDLYIVQALEPALLVLTGETLREGADGHVWSEMSEDDYQQYKDEWFTRTVIVLEKAE